MIASATNADPGNASLIQSLARRVQDLSEKVDWWNSAIIWSLVVAAIAAILVGVCTYVAFRRAKQLASAQADLASAKERQFTTELSETKLATAKAEEKAGDALVRYAQLEKEAAEARLETEKLKQALAWRVIPSDDAAALRKELADKPGAVNLRYTDGDPEALFLASQIQQILSAAGWQVASGAIKFSNAIFFGLGLTGTADVNSTKSLREGFAKAKVRLKDFTPASSFIGFGISELPGTPVLMIGSKKPPVP